MSNAATTGGEAQNTGTTTTSFDHGMETQAQKSDAAARSSAAAGEGELLHVYRLVPTAAPDDPRWQNAPSSGEVLVAARSSGDARIVAAGLELDFMEVDASPAEGVSTNDASAFRNEKLYTVIAVDRDRSDLTRGLLDGTVRVDTIRPSQA